MGDTDARAQHGMAGMERRAERHRPEPRPRGRGSSRRYRRQDPVYRELSQVRDRIVEPMGEAATPALRAALRAAGEGAAQARRPTPDQPLAALAVAGGLGLLLGLAVARAGVWGSVAAGLASSSSRRSRPPACSWSSASSGNRL